LSLVLAPFVLGAECQRGDDGEERKSCEEVCAVEAECEGLRTEEDCLAALCDDEGFRVVEDGDATVDFETLASNDCIREAEDCGAVILCTCADACDRTATCTGDEDATCEDTCAQLVENLPAETFTENRCKTESTCEDLPLCGGAEGGP
jgi:hypothetical protein